MGRKGITKEVDAWGLQAQSVCGGISKEFVNALKLNLKGVLRSSSFSQVLSVLFHQ